jgi:hypothetical protein
MATESDNVNSGALGTLVAVGTIAFFGIALVVTALVRAEMAEEVEKKEVSADRPYRDLVAEQTAKLNAPAAYMDRGKGLVSLPVDRAMELTVAGLAKDPNSATPPAPVGGAGGVGGAAAEAGGTGGIGGTGGAGGTGGTGGETAAVEGEKKDGDEPKPAEEPKKDEKKDEKKGAEKKKEAPKPKPAPGAPGSPAAPPPAAPTPAPAAPPPAPNGQ